MQLVVSQYSKPLSKDINDPPLIESQFGQLFGCLENQRDIVGLMSAVTNFARYGSIMGVFSEWHPWTFRVLQLFTARGNVGLVHMRELGENVINQMRAEGSDDKSKDKRPSELDCVRSDLVTSMTEKHRRYPDEFSRADIIYHMLPNVAAGAETTAATLTAVIYYICKHPAVLSRLRAELDDWAADHPQRDQDGIISYSEARRLHYLQAVLKETMRLFPANGKGLTRVVPKGGLVIANQSFPEGVGIILFHCSPPDSLLRFADSKALIDDCRYQCMGCACES